MRRRVFAGLLATAALAGGLVAATAGGGGVAATTSPTLVLPTAWMYRQQETISGTGFPASQSGEVYLVSGGTPFGLATFSTDASGAFTTSASIVEIAPGTDTFQVVMGSTYDPSLVIASSTSTILPATVTLGHAATPGGSLIAIPTNFGQDAVVYYIDGVYAGNAGYDLTLPTNISPGVHTVTAWPFTGSLPPSGPVFATATFTVPGTAAYSPPPANARYDLFAVQSLGELYQNVWTGAVWTGWIPLQVPPAGWASGVAAVKAGGRYDVFGADNNGQAYQLVWTGSAWTHPTAQGAPPAGFAGGFAATQVGGRYDIFGVGKDGQAYQKTWTGSAWTGWSSLGAPPVGLATGIAATQSRGRWDLFGVGNDGIAYQKAWTGSTWTGWTPQGSPGGPFTGGLAVTQDGGRYDIFGTRVDGLVYQKVWTGTAWTDWTVQGTAIGPYHGGLNGPLGVTESGGRFDLFAIGAGSFLKTWTGSTWTDWNVFSSGYPIDGDGLSPGVAAIRS
jgi:hypothetical protein